MIDGFAAGISFVGHHVIRGIFMGVLLLLFVKYIFKDKIETHHAGQIIRWVIVCYAIGAVLSTISLLFFGHSEEYAFLERATGPYAWAYFLLVVFSSVFPLVLLHQKLGKKLALLLLISVGMNIGWLFESFVVHLTSIHRDLVSENYNPYWPNHSEVGILSRGIFTGIVALVIGNGIKKCTPNHDNQK